MHNEAIASAARALASARSILVLTGAGISAESGIPTFRGPGGLWEGYRAEELATPAAFKRDPELVWRWYHWRRGICRAALPNPGHHALVELEAKKPGTLLLTQNVDGLHRRAGSRRLVELHGDIERGRCLDCGVVSALAPEAEGLPHCPRCEGRLRPHILWFGETYWPGTMDLGQRAAAAADLVLTVGTSAMVTAPASLAFAARAKGAVLIDVNPGENEIAEVAHHWLQGPSGELLPALLEVAAGLASTNDS